jgi:hypothetical protein
LVGDYPNRCRMRPYLVCILREGSRNVSLANSGAVAPHVVFLEYLLDGHVLVYAAYDVVEYLLLTLGEGGGSWHSTLAFYC